MYNTSIIIKISYIRSTPINWNCSSYKAVIDFISKIILSSCIFHSYLKPIKILRYCNDEQPNPTREREAAKVVAIVQERGLSSHRIIMGPSPPSRHYSPSFVERGGHRAVAEALNDGQCDALRRVVDASGAGSAGMGECVPLFVYATRGGGGTSAEEGWSLTSLASADAFDASNVGAKGVVCAQLSIGALLW